MRLSSSEQRLPSGQPYRAASSRWSVSCADQRLQPRLRGAVALERVEQRVDVAHVAVDRRLDELVLGLEVVVDVADRDVGRPRDVGDRRLLDALLMDHLARARDEALALALRLARASESVISPRG